jgi:hypothetical protein
MLSVPRGYIQIHMQAVRTHKMNEPVKELYVTERLYFVTHVNGYETETATLRRYLYVVKRSSCVLLV